MNGRERYYLPVEVADKYRYSVSFIYYLIRKKELKAAKIRRQIRIPSKEICRMFCQGTGDCTPCFWEDRH